MHIRYTSKKCLIELDSKGFLNFIDGNLLVGEIEREFKLTSLHHWQLIHK